MINILVGRKQIEWVSYNLYVSEHAKMRIIQRDNYEYRDLKRSVQLSPLQWRSYDDTIAIALDLYKYVIVKIHDNKADVLTFADSREFGKDITVVDRFLMTYREFIEKERKQNGRVNERRRR